MEFREIFEGVYKIDGRLSTRSVVPGFKVYGERTIDVDGIQYRSWDPYRSKLSAVILNGLKELPIKKGMNVLYLGAASGTTPSHISDIIWKDGKLYCVEFAPRAMRDLIKVCERRKNMLPILGDARKPEEYENDIGKIDCIYQDVAQPDQGRILALNSRLLKPGSPALLAIKSQSIDVTAKPKDMYNSVISALQNDFNTIERIDLNPFDKHHLFVTLIKK
ncbi:MAG: fibrillarin-like rRNA/tRNA 2'-O-methyltransferase [Candidatus Micrarchaeota archaeon]